MGVDRSQSGKQAGIRQDRRSPYPGERARQGRIVLTTPLRRVIFLGGLALALAVAFVLALAG